MFLSFDHQYLKVIVRLTDQVVKGFLCRDQWDPSKEVLKVHPADGAGAMEIRLCDTLAIYIVHTFEGNPEQESILFHKSIPPKARVWVRIIFQNGEEMEGLIENGPQFLLSAGFWMDSSDPTSNNIAVYVPKHNIRNFEVLGTRSHRNV